MTEDRSVRTPLPLRLILGIGLVVHDFPEASTEHAGFLTLVVGGADAFSVDRHRSDQHRGTATVEEPM